jgi:hypothetical protein
MVGDKVTAHNLAAQKAIARLGALRGDETHSVIVCLIQGRSRSCPNYDRGTRTQRPTTRPACICTAQPNYASRCPYVPELAIDRSATSTQPTPVAWSWPALEHKKKGPGGDEAFLTSPCDPV